jgi:hypothetical protein
MIGEHIRALKGGRWIHAIDCGDDTVLLLAEEPAPPRVRRAYRPEFVAGAAAVEAVTHRERTFPPAEVVRRAYSRASDPALAAMFGDSESFADWCTSGRTVGTRNVAVAAPVAAPGIGPGRSTPARRRRGAPPAKVAARTRRAAATKPARARKTAPKRKAKGRHPPPGKTARRRRPARRTRR